MGGDVDSFEDNTQGDSIIKDARPRLNCFVYIRSRMLRKSRVSRFNCLRIALFGH